MTGAFNVIYFIYLLYESLLPLVWGRHAPTPRKETRGKERVSEKGEEKRNRGTEGETSYLNPGT